MTIIIILLTVSLVAGRSLLMKAASDRDNTLPQILVIFSVAAVSSGLLGLAGGFTLHKSTLIIAVLFGICNFLSQYLNLKAMSTGMATRVVFICSCNFLVSSIYSIFMFHESVTVFRIIGILLICAAQLCFCIQPGEQKAASAGRAWMFYAIASMLFSGVVSIIQKYMRMSPYPDELVEMSTVAATVSVLLAATLLTLRRQWKDGRALLNKRRLLYFSLILGLCATSLNVFSTYAAGLIDGSLAFPVFNCGSLMLSILGARLIYRDKLGLRQKLCIAIGAVAISIIGF